MKAKPGGWVDTETSALVASLRQPPATFSGQRGEVLSETRDHGHTLRVVMYEFYDGSRRPYVEVSEDHGGAYPVRVLPLPEAVHLLQNATEVEVFAIGGRV